MATIMVKFPKDKVTKMTDLVEKMLMAGGKLMQCFEELEEGDLGERWNDYVPDRERMSRMSEVDDMDERYGSRYGSRMGERRYRH